ncbi:LysR family transcriptional regulator [Pseudomonas sp. RIT-PI-S]|uniref:LysR family transcriptional regulator n=1 Tax=Pseudomonas sp. RIT-PI-S TaxID=3035295 RepID=UPI0021DAA386|nr:LysR family transcriptional regulator [Pseudomonas sp. RIT-PI-S]
MPATNDDLCAFAVLMAAGSFTVAAQRLGWSKGQLSKRISAMEHACGVQLVHRTTRRLGLTAAGAALLPHARQLLEQSERARQALGALRDETSGLVRLTLPVSVGEAVFQPLFDFLTRTYPALRVEVDLYNGYRDLLREGFDLAVRDRVGSDERLVARPFLDIEELTCAAPAYLAQRGTPDSPLALSSHACLLHSYRGEPERWRYHRDHEPVEVQVSGPIITNHYNLLRQAALSGAGIARLPFYLIGEDLAQGRLQRLLPAYRARRLPLYLVHGYGAGMSRRVSVVADWLTQWGARARGGEEDRATAREAPRAVAGQDQPPR